MADVYMHGARGSNRRTSGSKKKRSSTIESVAKRPSSGGKTFRERTAEVEDYDFGRDLPIPAGGRTIESVAKRPSSGGKTFRERTAEVEDYDFGRDLPIPAGGRMPTVGSPSTSFSEIVAQTRDYDFGSRPLPTQRFAEGGVVDRIKESRSPLIGGKNPYRAETTVRGTIAEGFRNLQPQTQSETQPQTPQPQQAQPQTYGGVPQGRPTMTSQVGAQRAGSTMQGLQAQAQQNRTRGIDITPPGTTGEARVFPGSGDNEAARQGVMERTPTIQEGLATRAQSFQPQGGTGAAQQTTFGRFEGGQGLSSQARQQYEGIQNEMAQLSQMLERGARTNYEPGRPGIGVRRGISVPRMNAITARLGQLQNAQNALLGAEVDLAGQDAATERTIQQQLLANQGGMERTALQGQNTLEGIQARINDPRNQALAEATRAELANQNIQLNPLEPLDVAGMSEDQAQQAYQIREAQQRSRARIAEYVAESGNNVMDAFNQMRSNLAQLQQLPDEERDEAAVALERELQMDLQELAPSIIGAGSVPRNTQNFANGGMVGAPAGAMGGPVDMPSIQNYQQYVQLARQMGVDPVGMQEFSSMSAPPSNPGQPPMPEMQQGAQGSQQVIGMAGGGMVPSVQDMMANQVDGKVVMDADPNAPTDSIPATIDGEQPARLDSGEFVIPADVVMHFGTDKLMKMIQQARNAGNPDG